MGKKDLLVLKVTQVQQIDPRIKAEQGRKCLSHCKSWPRHVSHQPVYIVSLFVIIVAFGGCHR